MQFIVDNQVYDVVVTKKNTKRLYIRVKKDLKIYVTTSIWSTNHSIKKALEENYNGIVKMIDVQKKILENNDGFYYLGNKYEVNYVDEGTVRLDGDTAYIKKDYDIDKWYKKEALKVFQEELDEIYEKFTRKIPKPS